VDKNELEMMEKISKSSPKDKKRDNVSVDVNVTTLNGSKMKGGMESERRQEVSRNSGTILRLQQFRAMLQKKAIFTVRKWGLVLGKVRRFFLFREDLAIYHRDPQHFLTFYFCHDKGCYSISVFVCSAHNPHNNPWISRSSFSSLDFRRKISLNTVCKWRLLPEISQSVKL
jgi:hypothetical protein